MILFMVCSGGKHPLYNKSDDSETFKLKLLNPQWVFPENFPILAKHLFLKCVEIEPS